MSLPKWIQKVKVNEPDCNCPCSCLEHNRLAEAISLAWEALEKGHNYDGPIQAIHGLNGKAMRKIDKLYE